MCLKEKLGKKVKQGQCIVTKDRQFISQEETFLWLSRGDLKGQTKGEIIAEQEQAFQSIYHTTILLQTETDSK